MPMSKEEMLARIQAGAQNQNEPSLDPAVVAKIQQDQANRSAQGWNMPITAKPQDPNDAANQIIQDHINSMKGQQMPQDNSDQMQPQAAKQAALQQMVQAKQGNGINPETGMPFYSAPQQPSPQDAQRNQDMQMKMEALKRMSSGQQ